MPLQDDNDALDPSISADLDDQVVDTGNGAETENGAESSDALDVTEGEQGTLDVVRDVVGARKPEAASSAEGQEDGEKPPAGTPAKRDDENYTDVPFHKHERFQQLLRSKKANEADATRYRNVQGFLSQHGVSAEEASDALTIAALSRTDPVKAWGMLKPFVQQLLVAAGEVLPQELKARVQAGELTDAAAAEIAKERAQRTSLETTQKRTQEQQERDRQQSAAQSLYDAAVSWEQDRAAKDPNFAAKQLPLQKEIAYLHATEGRADTPEKVRDQLERAYKAVTPTGMIRRPAQTAPTVGAARRPAATSASTTRQPARERTTVDIIREFRAKRAAG